jgi:chemotaxis signal transduction protein
VVLVVQVGAVVCGIPVERVVEVMRPLPIVEGRAVVRGEPIAVIDAAVALGQPPGAGARFVIVRADGCNLALHVDAALGVREPGTVEPMRIGQVEACRLTS